MQPLKVTVIPVTPFAQNCSIVACTATNQAAIVDPGGDVARLRTAIEELKVTPAKILLTHGHIDHAGGAAELSEALAIPIEGPHEADAFLLSALEAQGARFGMTDVRSVTPTRWLTEGESVGVGDVTFSVLLFPATRPDTSCSSTRRRVSRWSAIRCSRVRSAAPTFPTATTTC